MADGFLEQLGQGLVSFGSGQTRSQIEQQRAQRDVAELQRQQVQTKLDKQARLQGILGRLGGGSQQPPTAQPAQALRPGGAALGQPVQPLQQLGQQVPGTTVAPAQLGAPQAPTIPFGNPQAIAELAVQFPDQFDQINKNLGLITQQQKDEAADFSFKLRNTPFEQRDALIDQREAQLTSQRRNPTDTVSLRGLSEEEQNQALELTQIAALSPAKRQEIAQGKPFTLSQGQQRFGPGGELIAGVAAGVEGLSAGQREFADLTAGLTEDQKREARLIELGLSPRAVGSAVQTISAQGIAEQIGDVEATIKERAKFGELTGASRSKSIDAGFETIRKIDKNVINLDRAIAAVEAGAGTGAIERRFPSIRAASVQLDQIQGELALDVIGAVTFGALSEGELNLAKQIALPTGLDGPQLIQHLRDRKSAQEKLRSYFNEQIEFLDQGGSVAGFLRSKERQTQQSPQAGRLQSLAPTDLQNLSDEELQSLLNEAQ